jgi:hypothetical protein
MGRSASWGWGKGIDGREAARLAAQQALSRLGAIHPAFGFVFVSHEFDLSPVLNGLSGVLGDIPLWGISTFRPIISAGEQARSVVVGLLAGGDLCAKVSFWPRFSQNSAETANQLLQALRSETGELDAVLLASDGINGDISRICAALTDFSIPVAGCMASGDIFRGKTFQIGGNQVGSGCLSVATLGGLKVGMGIGHGWTDIGISYEINRARDIWVQQLGAMPAAEAYSTVLGYPVRDWAFPPLNELVRLYPLGVELTPGSRDLIIRSPLQMEVDGSLRMNIPVAQGQVARLLVGDRTSCLDAARQAARTAMKALGKSKALLALIFVDQAWQYLFQSESTRFISAVKSEIGEIPLVGGYTLGQVYRPEGESLVRAYNQNLLMVVFGESEDQRR